MDHRLAHPRANFVSLNAHDRVTPIGSNQVGFSPARREADRR